MSLFKQYHVNKKPKDASHIVSSPINGKEFGRIKFDSIALINNKVTKSEQAFKELKLIPAPKRGDFIRELSNELRNNKKNLAEIVTRECGKTLVESLGEVQEMIDICDYAVGLSRKIGGLTLPSERNNHKLEENWYPIGPILVISAFNFPVAVWCWNFTISVICGNPVLWKPSEKTPFTAIICNKIVEKIVKRTNFVKNISQVILADREISKKIVKDKKIPLVSATGSTKMGRYVAKEVSSRFGKLILELGGNNASIITANADIDSAIESVTFGAIGTSGQRCTSTRRVFIHKSIYSKFIKKLKKSFKSIETRIGDPLQNNLMGPLIDEDARIKMFSKLEELKPYSKIHGGKKLNLDGEYVTPAIIEMKEHNELVHEEVFAPILYVFEYSNIEEAVALNNSVPQGLSSSIFSSDIKEIEYFKHNSDCGIANVNIGTSGAEIGGAFGGEKETGGGRESGSDAWKAYMRRQTSTIFFGEKKPELAQGVNFD